MRWGLQPDGPSFRSLSPGKAVRSLELTLGLAENQVYNQLPPPPPPGTIRVGTSMSRVWFGVTGRNSLELRSKQCEAFHPRRKEI